MNSKVSVKDHPLRYSLANEIHARPSPSLKSPCQAAYLVFKREHNAASRDRRVDLEQLNSASSGDWSHTLFWSDREL